MTCTSVLELEVKVERMDRPLVYDWLASFNVGPELQCWAVENTHMFLKKREYCLWLEIMSLFQNEELEH